MTLFLSLSLSHIKSRILSLSLSVSADVNSNVRPPKSRFFVASIGLWEKALLLILSHKHTSSHKASQSYKTHTIFLSLSSISLPHSIFKTYLHLSFSLSLTLSLCFFFKPPPITQSLSLIYTERLYQFFENYFSSDSQNTNQNQDHNSLSLSLAPSGAFVFATVFGKIIKN